MRFACNDETRSNGVYSIPVLANLAIRNDLFVRGEVACTVVEF